MANYMTAIREIEQIVDNAPELNMNNYDEMQVDELNSAMIEICNILGNLAECESQEATIEAKAALPLHDASNSVCDDEQSRVDSDYFCQDDDYEPDYSDFDCSCGAWIWDDKSGKPIHVADCICGSSEPW